MTYSAVLKLQHKWFEHLESSNTDIKVLTSVVIREFILVADSRSPVDRTWIFKVGRVCDISSDKLVELQTRVGGLPEDLSSILFLVHGNVEY